MKTTGDFILHHFDIPLEKYGEPISIIPFGDCHFGAPLFAEDKWQEFTNKYRKRKNCYFFGMGDYMDVISTSERRAMKNADLHESTEHSLDRFIRNEAEAFCKSISFMKGKIIGMLGGNHYYQFPTGMTSDHFICEQLGCKYLGVKTLTHITFHYSKGGASHSVVISAHHGESGGKMPGSSINKLYHMSSGFDADIHLMGHDHQKLADFTNKIGVNYSKGSLLMYNKKVLLARTGSFLRGYVDGRKSYVCDSNMPPTDLGAIEILITINRHVPTRDLYEIDIKVVL